MRRELLDAYSFESLREARRLGLDWQRDYNNERPHKSLGYLSPVAYAARYSDDNTGKALNSEAEADESTAALSTNPRRGQAPKLVAV